MPTYLAEQVVDGAGDGLGEALDNNVGEEIHVRAPLGHALGDLGGRQAGNARACGEDSGA